MGLTIGKVARSAGVGVETVRYYERRKLLPEPPRTTAGYRQYPSETVDRIRFIRHAKELGFTLAEIKELLALRVRNRSNCKPVRKKALEKIESIRRRIEDLQRVSGVLEGLVRACDMKERTNDCPILESLDERIEA